MQTYVLSLAVHGPLRRESLPCSAERVVKGTSMIKAIIINHASGQSRLLKRITWSENECGHGGAVIPLQFGRAVKI